MVLQWTFPLHITASYNHSGNPLILHHCNDTHHHSCHRSTGKLCDDRAASTRRLASCTYVVLTILNSLLDRVDSMLMSLGVGSRWLTGGGNGGLLMYFWVDNVPVHHCSPYTQWLFFGGGALRHTPLAF